MKRTLQLKTRLAFALAILAAPLASLGAQAAGLTWDASATGAGQAGGAGVWLTALPTNGMETLPSGSYKVKTDRGTKFIDYRPVPSQTALVPQVGPAGAPQPKRLPAPLTNTFKLHSWPSATKVIYLDFDGHVGYEGNYKPFNFENPDSTFSTNELARIQEIWMSVAEDFMPFDVDVTTEDPGIDGIVNSGGGDTRWGQRCVITKSPWNYSWAYQGTFGTDYECYAYAGDNSWIWIADSISHEVGHTLGLDEHGQNPGDGTYYAGHGSGNTYWAPIMGWTKMSAPYGLSQWDQGEYANATPVPHEDSLAIITTTPRNGFGYRPDDHGSTTATATPMVLPATNAVVAEGLIEQRTDVDYFSFTLAASGTVSLVINADMHPSDATHRSSNLDVLAKIYNSGGTVLYTSNPSTEIYASFTNVALAAGTYYLSIDGTGLNNPTNGYSDYGSLGYYSIQGFMTGGPPTSNANLANLVPSAGTLSPAFNSATTSYTASVPYLTTNMTVTPTAAAGTNATIKVNGTTVASGSASGPISLAVGANLITTVVVSPNASATNTYTLTVTRAALSSNAWLANLVPSAGTLSPGFASNRFSYTASVPYSATSLTVTPTAADPGAAIKVNGATVASGTASGPISLNVGANLITTVVVSQDTTATNTYTLTVTRTGNAYLASLVPSAGTLSPAFASNTLSYTASVPYLATNLTVTPTAADPGATIKVNGNTVASGSASGSISLSVGSNTVTTVVVSPDLTATNTYTVTVTRAAPGITIANAGFENPVLANGAFSATVPGWSQGRYNVSAPTVWIAGVPLNYDGVYNPDNTAYTCGCAPEGQNMGYATSLVGYDVGLNQVLSATLQANAQYVLSAVVGNPSVFNGGSTANYRIELVAGGVVLAANTGPSPVNSTYWTTARLTYASGAAPAQLGQPLEIRLLAVNYPTGYEVDFDNVQLTSALTPPTLSGYGPLTGTSFPLTFSGPSGQTYQVLRSTNVALPLASWWVLNSGTFGVGGPTSTNYTDTSATNATQFYRIQSP
jgi:hypothetical protein